MLETRILQSKSKLQIEYSKNNTLPRICENNLVRFGALLTELRAESSVLNKSRHMELRHLNQILARSPGDLSSTSRFYLFTKDYLGFVICTLSKKKYRNTALLINQNLISQPIKKIKEMTEISPYFRIQK